MPVEELKTIFDWAAVILLFLTFASGLGVLITGNIINKRQAVQLRDFDRGLTAAKIELGQQQVRAADADARVAGVETELAKQRERTAIAEKSASDAALALARFKQPRILSKEQQDRIAAKVKSFAGTTFDVAASNRSEPLTLVVQIEESLSSAGWKELNWPGSTDGQANTLITRPGKTSVGMAIETGVTIQVKISEKAELLGAAKILASALSA
jgi:hypothetical protein